jgi:hypothetical protein
MTEKDLSVFFDEETINKILPEDLADRFFDALYGDASEGAYNIGLKFKEQTGKTLVFEFHLTQRPGKCLRCNLTYGLPKVFARHPVIDMEGLVQKIDEHLDGRGKCSNWQLGRTEEVSDDLHVMPLTILLETS